MLEGPLLEEVVCLHKRVLRCLAGNLPMPPRAASFTYNDSSIPVEEAREAERVAVAHGAQRLGHGLSPWATDRAAEFLQSHALGASLVRDATRVSKLASPCSPSNPPNEGTRTKIKTWRNE